MATITVNLTNVQETLVSGTNIKTVNGTSLLGSGDLVTADSSLGVADQSITDLSRVVSLNTSDATSSLTFEKADGMDILTVKGDNTVNIPTGTLNVNGASTYGILASGTMANAIAGATSVANGRGVTGTATGVTGTNAGLQGIANGVSSGVNVGLIANAQNGALNWAIRVTSGDIKFSQATQNITLNGNTSADKVVFENASGTDILTIAGDGTIGVNTAPNSVNGLTATSAGYTAGIRAIGNGTYGMRSEGNMNIAIGATTTKSSGTNYAVQAKATGVGGTSNSALQVEASGATNNYAIDVIAGDIKFSQATQNITLNGNTSSDKVVFENASGTDILTLAGDETVGIGVAPTSTIKLRVQSSTAGDTAVRGDTNATTGSNYAVYGRSVGSGATKNVGLRASATGATTNYAIEVLNGGIKMPSGTGQTGTYTFGGGGSGDIASMQFENGILIATTTVP